MHKHTFAGRNTQQQRLGIKNLCQNYFVFYKCLPLFCSRSEFMQTKSASITETSPQTSGKVFSRTIKDPQSLHFCFKEGVVCLGFFSLRPCTKWLYFDVTMCSLYFLSRERELKLTEESVLPVPYFFSHR